MEGLRKWQCFYNVHTLWSLAGLTPFHALGYIVQQPSNKGQTYIPREKYTFGHFAKLVVDSSNRDPEEKWSHQMIIFRNISVCSDD